MTTTPKRGIEEIPDNLANVGDSLRETVRVFDALSDGVVVSRSLITPPAAADVSNGDVHIIAAGAVDEWSGWDGYLVFAR